MIILSRQEMYDCDHYTIKKLGIPGKTLMENAGKGSAEFIKRKVLNIPSKVIIFCGSGNNGGDGYVIGRYLAKWDYQVLIVSVGDISKMSAETRENYESCLKMEIKVINPENLECWQNYDINIKDYQLVIDAIFGVGLKGNLRGWICELVEQINKESLKTIAIDIPSGVDAETGMCNKAIMADYTLTMAAVKYGLLIDAGRFHSGEIKVIDIGMPDEVIKRHSPPARLINTQNIILPARKQHFHKGDYGRIAIVAGSKGLSGAAIMSARAALRSGAGLITLFHPQGMDDLFESQLLEVMTRSIPSNIQDLLPELQKFDAVLFGPGIGKGETAQKILVALAQNWNKPMIIDADAINLLSENLKLIKSLSGKQVLLTPHMGEFARLCGISVADLMADRVNILNKFCRKHKVSVLLKSSTSICCNGKDIVFNISGNDGLATGGSGDVLSGITISLTGQGLEPFEAGTTASFILGKTAEQLAQKRETRSIIPSDIINELFKYEKYK